MTTANAVSISYFMTTPYFLITEIKKLCKALLDQYI